MRTTFLRRALVGTLAALVVLAAVAPGSIADAHSRPRKIEPRFMAPYRAGGNFTPNTDILSASGYAAWMIDEVLASNTPLPKLGAAFTAAERTKGINARYFVAHALLESGWGTSDIARLKHNLFGYGAFDRNPWKYATRFRTYEQGILAVATSIHDDYLSPTGRWWYGFTTLRAMNRYYASDVHWAAKIAVLANMLDGLVVTLGERGLRFGSPALVGAPTAGARIALDVPWSARPGAVLPPAIRFRVRWTPLAVVEAGADVPAEIPGPTWALAARTNRPGRVARLALGVPSQPGLYRLDVEARDSDGQALPASDAPPVRSLTVRVADVNEATLGISLQPDGSLAASIHTIGSAPLGVGPDETPTVLEAWALPLDASLAASLLVATPLGRPLAPGATLLVPLPVPTQPSVVVLRLAGDPGTVGRSLPAAALVTSGTSGSLAVAALPVDSPRDDALLGLAPSAGRVSLLPSSAPGSVDVAVTDGPAAPSADATVSAVKGSGGHASLLVRSLGVDPSGAADPLGSLVQLSAGPPTAVRAEVTGMAPGVRLVVAAIVPPDGTPADATTLSLAWVPIAAVDAPGAVAP